ncbi:MAG: type II secretion system F family protein [Candidatus Eremiobacteraeota bacterium]|nr:type II secretion system F family protein [Candidatus Eremiobacteraeota bacterium]
MSKPLEKYHLMLPVSSSDYAVCFRELATLYRAGVPIAKSMKIIAGQAGHPGLRAALESCEADILSGKSIARSLEACKAIFPVLTVKMIDIGEKTGRLEIMLERIAFHAEKTRELNMKISAALVYPLFVALFFLAFLIVAPSMLFKGILQFLGDLNMSLPLPTRIFMGISAFIRSGFFPVAVIMGIFLLFIAFRSLCRQIYWKIQVQNLLFSLPVIGKSLRMVEAARFARTLSIIYDTGMPLLEGLDITREGASSIFFSEKIAVVREEVSQGVDIFTALSATGFFPATFLHLVEAGEQSGRVKEMLDKAADICEESLEESLNTVITVMQPFILLAIGIIAAFIMIATMTPLLQVIQGLS